MTRQRLSGVGALALLLAVAQAAPNLGCDTIFPARDLSDAGVTSGGNGGGGGSVDNNSNIVYPYSQGCNCAQGYACTESSGCQSYTCFASGATWFDAQGNCARQGMQLAFIQDDTQNKFVASACAEAGAEKWWIGAQDIATEGAFFSEGGVALSFTSWSEGSPKAGGSGGAQNDCAVMDKDGKWQDVSCNDKFAYACVTPTSGVQSVASGTGCFNPGMAVGCGIGQTCTTTSGNQPVNVCLRSCEGASECTEETRCTSTDKGKFCLKRCETTADCVSDGFSLRCIHVGGGDGVCWTQGSKSGEVVTKPVLVLDRIEINAAGGVMPGAQISLGIYVKNQGEGDATDVTATVSQKDAFTKGLVNESGGPAFIGAGQEGVLVVSPQFSLANNLPLNQPVGFQITLNDGASGLQWTIPFEITAFKSAALVWVSEVQITSTDSGDQTLSPGESGSFVAYAENLGFAAASGVTAKVAVKSGKATISNVSASALGFGDPTTVVVPAPPQGLLQGTLAIDPSQPAADPILLKFTITESGGTEWIQDVAVPLQ
ncbi:MAG: hypothetical protein AMXMBFR64_34550 [Myxococcales bacterium]